MENDLITIFSDWKWFRLQSVFFAYEGYRNISLMAEIYTRLALTVSLQLGTNCWVKLLFGETKKYSCD